MRTIVLFFLPLLQIVCGTGFTNVVFHPENTLYGDSINQLVKIRGSYSNIIWSGLTGAEKAVVMTSLPGIDNLLNFGQEFKSTLYVCPQNTPRLVVELASTDVANSFHENIANFKAGKGSADMKEVIDFTAMGCKNVFTGPINKVEDLDFMYEHTFTYHHPILFIDAFGYNSFNYMQKETDDQNQDESAPLRYCEGNEYNGEMYSLGKRPVCPDIHDRDNGTHTRGRLTLYKKNIVSITHNVYWCTQTRTHIKSGRRFLGSTWDNRPLIGIHSVPSEEECWKWVNTHTSSNFPGSKSPITTLSKITDGSYATNNDKSFGYPYCSSDPHDVYDAYLIESKLTVEMPSLEIVTPFGRIPTNKLYEKTHVFGNKGRLVWKAFTHNDICTHVPYASSDAESIRYEHKQYNNQRSRTPQVTYTNYFIAEKLKLFEAVDSSKEVESSVKYNCITRPPNSVMFTTNSETLLKFEDVPVVPHLTKYPHSSFDHLLVSSDKSVVSAVLANSHSSKISNHNTANLQQGATQPIDTWTMQAKAINKTLNYNSPTIDHDLTQHGLLFINASQKAASASGSALPIEIEDYNNYMNQQTQKRNAAKLAHDLCKHSQTEYDTMSRTLAVNPTRLIVQKTKRPIEAKYAGTNFFSIRSCSDITIVRVVPTLFTNSSVAVEVNGVLTKVNDLVSNLSVTPSNLTCLAGVLIVFKVGPEDKTRQSTELVGQVDAEGIVRTDKAQLLEPCSRNSMGSNHKIFSFRRKTYVFTNYIQEYEVSHELFYQKQHTKHQKAQDTLKSKGATAPKYATLDEIINKIKFLEVSPPPVLEGFQFAPTSLYGSKMYTIAELSSLPISIGDLVMRQAYDTNFDNAVTDMIESDYSDSEDASTLGADEVFSAIGNGISDVVKGGAEAVATVIHAGGSVLHSVVKDGESVFKSVGSTLSDTLSSLVVPIAVVGGLVLVGTIVVYVLYKKYMTGSVGSSSSKKKKKRNKKKQRDSMSSSSENSTETDAATDVDDRKYYGGNDKQRLL